MKRAAILCTASLVAVTAIVVTGSVISAATTAKKTAPAAASNGTTALVVWEDWRAGNPDIYGARMSASGALLDPNGIPIATGPSPDVAPDVAWNGSTFLVAWGTSNEVDNAISYARVSPNGVVSPPVRDIAHTADSAGGVQVAASGPTFLITYRGSHGVDNWIGATLVPGGSITIDPGFDFDDSGDSFHWWVERPAVAANNNGFLVAWGRTQTQALDEDFDIFARRVSRTGSMGTPVRLTSSSAEQIAPGVAWNGTNWLVAWEDHRNGKADIYGTRLSTALQALNPGGKAIGRAAGGQIVPAAAANGSMFYIGWTDWRLVQTADIFGQRVGNDGTNRNGTSGFGINRSAGTQRNVDLAKHGSNILAVWEDNREGSWDIYGTRISPTAVLSSSGAAISK
jgi:hypothetical protein